VATRTQVLEVWLVRHGQTEWSRQRRHTGRTDVPLEPDGEQGARELAMRLAGTSFDLILASPLQRAWHTAELAGLRPVPSRARSSGTTASTRG